MKKSIIALSCIVAVVSALTFWNNEALAQSGSEGGAESSDLPLNSHCIVTLDALSNSRSTMTPEMQDFAGFVRPDTAEGTLIKATPQWIVLQNMNSTYWIPRGKVLMVKVHPQ